jgi:hypothetical protein
MKIRGRLSDSVSNGYKLFGQKTSRLFSAQACRRVAAVQEQLFLQKLSTLRVVLARDRVQDLHAFSLEKQIQDCMQFR